MREAGDTCKRYTVPAMNVLQHLLQILPGVDLRPGSVRDFHHAVMEALQDGKLTEEEIASLETKREELGLSKEVLAMLKIDLYMSVFQKVSADELISEDDWDEMEQIQDYLEIDDREIKKTKKELLRLRIMSEIRHGNLPVLPFDGFIPKKNELLHWTETVTIIRPSRESTATVNLGKGSGLIAGRIPPRTLSHVSCDGTAVLYLTNKRLILKGDSLSLSINTGSIIDAECYVGGLILHVNKRKPILLKYMEQGNHNIVGSVLFAIAAPQSNENGDEK